MAIFRVWERGVYTAREIESEFMRSAVNEFAEVKCVLLSGSPTLSTRNNTVRWIATDGSAREFTAYQVI
jgi:hypothetical protein